MIRGPQVDGHHVHAGEFRGRCGLRSGPQRPLVQLARSIDSFIEELHNLFACAGNAQHFLERRIPPLGQLEAMHKHCAHA